MWRVQLDHPLAASRWIGYCFSISKTLPIGYRKFSEVQRLDCLRGVTAHTRLLSRKSKKSKVNNGSLLFGFRGKMYSCKKSTSELLEDCLFMQTLKSGNDSNANLRSLGRTSANVGFLFTISIINIGQTNYTAVLQEATREMASSSSRGIITWTSLQPLTTSILSGLLPIGCHFCLR